MCLGENRHFLYNCTFALAHDAVVTQTLAQRVRWKDLNEALLFSPKPQKEQKPVFPIFAPSPIYLGSNPATPRNSLADILLKYNLIDAETCLLWFSRVMAQ
jgi:hypothetical protein